jgi:hypothetical protein
MDQILRKQRIAARGISNPDGVERMAAGGELEASMPRQCPN